MKLCINCKKAEKNGTYYICITPEIQEWEKHLRTSFVTGKITPIYCDAARSSEKICGPEGKYYDEHTKESRAVGKVIPVTAQELREMISGHSPAIQPTSREEGTIRLYEDKNLS